VVQISALSDFLSQEQIAKCQEIWDEHKERYSTLGVTKKILEEVVAPNIEEINQKLGQENDPRFMSYVIEGFLMGVLPPTEEYN